MQTVITFGSLILLGVCVGMSTMDPYLGVAAGLACYIMAPTSIKQSAL